MDNADLHWTEGELKDAVFAYKQLQGKILSGQKVVKADVYRQLSAKWGRTEGSYERRMGNISYVLHLQGRAWIPGLKPLSNVGTNVIAIIEKCLNEIDDESDLTNSSFEIEVAKKYKEGDLKIPLGVQSPSSKKSFIHQISRDPTVKAWLLRQSQGRCEACDQPAPFNTEAGIPYLEVHHVIRLADRGPDTPSNAVAVCPNCHKALHYSEEREYIVQSLYKRIPRLSK